MTEKIFSNEKSELPPIVYVEGAAVSREELQRRMHVFMEAIDGLADAYQAEIVTQGLHSKDPITIPEFTQVCQNLSLRPEPFYEWDKDYFEEDRDRLLEAAKQRGSDWTNNEE